jgi:predicted dehydrogenase
MAGDKIKAVLIGAGGWGGRHARILAAHKDVQFCALARRTEAKTTRELNVTQAAI